MNCGDYGAAEQTHVMRRAESSAFRSGTVRARQPTPQYELRTRANPAELTPEKRRDNSLFLPPALGIRFSHWMPYKPSGGDCPSWDDG